MSSIRLVILPAAHQDWSDILQYTEEQWGLRQRDAYDDLIDETLRRIRSYPDIGHRVDGLPDSHREFPMEHHAVRYLRESNRVVILRIVSHRSRPTR